jgi:transposase InsO family protein
MTLAKYELIDAEKARHSIARMCAWLGVSRSGYYEWRERPASATAQRRTLLAALVAEIFAGSHETYGYRRVHAALARRGEHCSAELVRALMRKQGLIPAQMRAFRPTTPSPATTGASPTWSAVTSPPSSQASSSSATSPTSAPGRASSTWPR